MTSSTEGRIMQSTGNSFDGITGTWELVTEGLFPVVASGKFETNIHRFGQYRVFVVGRLS